MSHEDTPRLAIRRVARLLLAVRVRLEHGHID